MTSSDPRPLTGGPLHAAIANEIVRLVADFTGRGASRSRAFLSNDTVVCLLEDGATKVEERLVAAGEAQAVRINRDSAQRVMEAEFVAAIERLTGRKVITFLSGTSTSADTSVEVFVLEPTSAVAVPPHDG